MSTAAPIQGTQSNGELVQILSTEAAIRQRLEEERQRLEKEAGIERREVHHFHKPIERAFTKPQRDNTTVLFGGLTWKHERMVHAALERLGYRCESVPVPNKKAFQLGKEYGNNGQCNPTYFTVGNLVQYVQDLESKGLTNSYLRAKEYAPGQLVVIGTSRDRTYQSGALVSIDLVLGSRPSAAR